MKINVNHHEKLEAALAKVQTSRITVRTITAADIWREADLCEKRLQQLLPQKVRRGARVAINLHAQVFPSAYRGEPLSTWFELTRGPKDWFVTRIWRYTCHGPTSRRRLYLEDQQREALADYAIKGF